MQISVPLLQAVLRSGVMMLLLSSLLKRVLESELDDVKRVRVRL